MPRKKAAGGVHDDNSYPFSKLQRYTATPIFCTQTPTFSTQTPTFSTQTSSISDDDGDRVDETSPGTIHEARTRWSQAEDAALVSAWLNTSKDGTTANEQKAGAFWKRVTRFYSACSSVKDLPPRGSNNCKQRWAKINEGVQKFCGNFEMAGRQATSGQSEDDVFQMAYKMFNQDQKTNFTLGHAWRMLRNDQKWCSLCKGKGKALSKRAQPEATVAGTQMEEEVEERPIGVKGAKAAKLKANEKGTRTSEDKEAAMNRLQIVAALSEKQFANNNILANKKLLDNLLCKTEPLDEIELELKRKLIRQIL
ncbi:unnamed protein product [Microthlaspi erraticum]|uniref:Myb-like domain-containing protein n=1 Tax=Microthlaspi erraticum TaxID=1685480 RepID=A0A6D2J3P4_9BRAS|nr:unnamed protein product [Microthlaspi erraticum]